jgi:D-alanyl-D-alanine carboxypeptidase/D-alanyl-D-alanine-endopeptidase (penicillin-binding protein 4)
LLNFNALHLHLVPAQKSATVLLDPDLAGYIINNQISTTNEAICGNNDLINPQINSHTITLIGNIPNNCGELDEFFSLLPHDEYFFSVFSALWKELGGVFHGKVFIGSAPENQKAFSTHLSQPLSELIRDINKFSNNTMARQLFLTLSARNDTPANISQSSSVVQHWLNSIPLAMPELILENGAGLSRKERISAQHLADLLRLASQSRYAAEFESSLPLLGLDGTVKKRFKENELTGFAHLKTGTLDGVKSIAGYVQGKTGSKFILVFIVNHENAALSQPAQDLLIEWIYNNH